MNRRRRLSLLAALATTGLFTPGLLSVHAAPAPGLLRYPYLTDDSGTHATVELATDSFAPVTLTYGEAPGCTGKSTSASGVSFLVKTTHEYQFSLHLRGLKPGTTYCYGITQHGVNLLGSDPSPSFKSALAPWDPAPFSFAVIGDWGFNGNGPNPQLASLMSSIHNSGVSFVVSTGDAAYNDGSQTNYGDLHQTGPNVSAVFGPDYWARNGASIPMFSALGDHGFSVGTTFLTNWDATDTAADSMGKDVNEIYSGKDGTAALSYPSIWYAFDWGEARFYILSGVWAYGNLGAASQYQVDYDYHWAPGAPEVTWLQNDLQQHQGVPKFAFVYFPFHSDSSAQPTDTFYGGPNGLESMLANAGTVVAFNGHAHIYERNVPQVGAMATYIGGGGGGVLETVGSCSGFDAYALGWSPLKGRGSSCNAPTPTAQNQVNEYTLVTVNGSKVTVAPVNAGGSKFDVQSYQMVSNLAAKPTHFKVSTPKSVTTGSTFQATIEAKDDGDATADSYTGEHELSWDGLSPSPKGGKPAFPSNPVAFDRGVAKVPVVAAAPGTTRLAVTDGTISGSSDTFTVLDRAGGGPQSASTGWIVIAAAIAGAVLLALIIALLVRR
ncbi:MAG TPA: hypothetical protein VJU79_04635, partial [Candidatus Dormibacteraeota bacterium]|nr:hypothetical protein [Candidatus Dormibacteraeota bacterium]